ncbi:MAG: hypothetical protein ABI824_13250 [Acidobacteriota bacterium]
MIVTEITASAEIEFRDAVLSEFLKPELPAPVTLLRHAQRYLVKVFDAHAEHYFNQIPAGQDFYTRVEALIEYVPRVFFGNFGCPWARTIEHAMLGLVDHTDGPHPCEKEILDRYLDVEGQLFVKYALVTRAGFWHARASAGQDKNVASPAVEGKKRGRPSKMSDDLKREALKQKGNRPRACILYGTKFPTPQQVKNVSTILRHFRTTHPDE